MESTLATREEASFMLRLRTGGKSLRTKPSTLSRAEVFIRAAPTSTASTISATSASTTQPMVEPRRIRALPEADISAPMLFSTRWNTGSTFHSMMAMISTSITHAQHHRVGDRADDGGADAVLAGVIIRKAVHDLFQLAGLLADADHLHQVGGPAVVPLQRLVERARLGDGLAGALVEIGILAAPGGLRQGLHAVIQRQARAEDQRHLAAEARQLRGIKRTFLSGHEQ